MGVRQPFEKVVARHGDTVLRVCRALLPAHDAEDAWSETFLAAMRGYPDLPATANIEAFLVTIAHRKAIDVLRARKRQPLPVGELPEVPAGLGVPGAGAGELWQAVRALPGKQRQAVAYHYVAGLPYAEIAQILGGSTEAARRAAACATNPLPVIVPCHRVLRNDGRPGGYVGGPAAKTALLRLEAAA